MKWLGIMLMAVLLAIVPGYGQAQPQAKEATEVKPAPAANYTPEARKDYEKIAAKDLEALEQQIRDLSVKAHTAAPQIKRTMVKAAVSLDKQAVAARKMLGDLQKASQKNWGDIKTAMDKALDDLKKSYDDVEARLK